MEIREKGVKNVLEEIKNHLTTGGRVVVATYTKATVYDNRHVNMFSANDKDLFVNHGKRPICITYTSLRFCK